MNKVHAEKCRRSFYYFVQFFWETIISEKPVWNWHIKYLCEELQEVGKRVARREHKEYDYYIINIPPGSSKSTIISEMYPLWCWTFDSTQKFICASYSSTIAEDLAGKSYEIYNSEKFKALFPELHGRGKNGGKTNFRNGLKGQRYTTSTGSTITGIHAHQKIVDDPMTPALAYSSVERDKVNRWFDETLSSRNVNHDVTVTIIVMQRLHEKDSTGYILEKVEKGSRIKHICIPAEVTELTKSHVKPASLLVNYKGGLFDPERRSRQNLEQVKIELGSYGYAGQMGQMPAPAEGGIIKKNWFEIVQRQEPPKFTIQKFQLDTAYTDDTNNDPTAVISYYIEGPFVFITNVQSVNKEFPDLIRWMPEFMSNNYYTNRSMIHVEPKASGKSVVQTIKKATNLNITESKPPTVDKITRVHNVSPKLEAGRVKLHAGGWNESFIGQCTTFPNAEHDDEVDCLVAIIERELMTSNEIQKLQGIFF